MKYFKKFENYTGDIEDIKLSSYVENFGYDSLNLLSSGMYESFAPSIVKYIGKKLDLTTYFISDSGSFRLNKLYYFLFVDNDGNSVDITLITNDDNKKIDINMINSSTVGIGLGKIIIEEVKNFALDNDYIISVSNVTNTHFWDKLGFKEWGNGKEFLRFNN